MYYIYHLIILHLFIVSFTIIEIEKKSNTLLK